MLTWLRLLWTGELPDHAPRGARRSSHWPAVRAAHLRREPRCMVCGGTEHVQVHHVVPFHVDPDLELAPDNLLTLCEAKDRLCHYTFGHGYSWLQHNPNVRADVAAWAQRVKAMRTVIETKGRG